MQPNTNIPLESETFARRRTVVQVIETDTGTLLRELDASASDPEKVAEGAMRNLDPYRYFTRIVHSSPSAA